MTFVLWRFIPVQSKADASLINKLLRSQLVVGSKADLEVIQKDPNSPLHSVKSFEALNLWALAQLWWPENEQKQDCDTDNLTSCLHLITDTWLQFTVRLQGCRISWF